MGIAVVKDVEIGVAGRCSRLLRRVTDVAREAEMRGDFLSFL